MVWRLHASRSTDTTVGNPTVQPRTISAWQRKGFRDRRARLSGKTKPGRLSTSAKIRQLIRQMLLGLALPVHQSLTHPAS